ncbi:MAG TPA: outer membrane protein assembly factor BamD [Phycisphaerae bacterium]|nr:outer membrane protein assembly factor BamD [Phycisphaerae bacterium]
MTRLPVILILALAFALPASAGEEAELIWKDGKWAPLPAPAKGTPEGEAAIVRQEIDAGRHDQAVKAAKAFLKNYSLHPLREDVLAMAGDAQMRLGNYWKAHLQYKQQLGEFPKGALSERALEREMEIAKAFLDGRKRTFAGVLKIGAADDGVEILESVAVHAPISERAEIALITIGDYYFDNRRWEEAAAQYDGFISLYPKSPRGPYARLRAAESFRRAYRGGGYDETPLIEAETRYKAFRREHPAAAAEAKVDDILRQIHSDRARKQFTVGRFYLRIGRKEAARYYFALVTTEFSDTVWAEEARQELANLPAEPAEPAGPAEPKPQAEAPAS